MDALLVDVMCTCASCGNLWPEPLWLNFLVGEPEHFLCTEPLPHTNCHKVPPSATKCHKVPQGMLGPPGWSASARAAPTSSGTDGLAMKFAISCTHLWVFNEMHVLPQCLASLLATLSSVFSAKVFQLNVEPPAAICQDQHLPYGPGTAETHDVQED